MALWAKNKAGASKGQQVRIPDGVGVLVARAVPEGVVILDAANNVFFMNALAERTLTMSYDDARGLNIHSLLHLANKDAEILTPDKSPLEQALSTRQPLASKEYSLLSAGAKIPISLVVAPDPKTGYTVITFRDIGEELRIQGSASELISVASHELRTPMTAIEGYLSLAMNPATATIDERGRDLLDKAHREVGRLGSLFSDLIDAAKINDGKMILSLTRHDLTPIVEETIQRFRPLTQKKGISLVKTSGTNVQPTYFTNIDVNATSEILDNLLENALKYTSAGTISVSIIGDERNVRVVVEDTGIGMTPDDIRHIFEKFYRANNSLVREIGGTGLGLYLSMERAKAMHGTITAESAGESKGSKLTLVLPRVS